MLRSGAVLLIPLPSGPRRRRARRARLRRRDPHDRRAGRRAGRGAAELDGVIEDVVAASARQATDIGQRLVADMDAMVASNRAIEASGVAGREAVGRRARPSRASAKACWAW